MRLCFLFASVLSLAALLCGCIKHPEVPYYVYDGAIRTEDGVLIDTGANTLTFSDDAVLEYADTQCSIGGVVFDCSRVQDGDKLFYHLNTGRISSYDAHESVYLGIYHQPAFLTRLNMDSSKLYVDGKSAVSLAALRDMTVACLGDSMTSGSKSIGGYPEFLPELLGSETVLNYGLSESSIAGESSASSQTDMLFRCTQIDESADIIIVLGCLNDWMKGLDIDSSASPGVSFRDDFRSLCQTLKQNYPNARIYVFSSPQSNPANKTAKNLEGTQWEGNTEGYNAIGLRQIDYSNAMKAVCAEEDIPFCPLTETLCWEVFDGETQYTVGEKTRLIAEKISEFILASFE